MENDIRICNPLLAFPLPLQSLIFKMFCFLLARGCKQNLQ